MNTRRGFISGLVASCVAATRDRKIKASAAPGKSRSWGYGDWIKRYGGTGGGQYRPEVDADKYPNILFHDVPSVNITITEGLGLSADGIHRYGGVVDGTGERAAVVTVGPRKMLPGFSYKGRFVNRLDDGRPCVVCYDGRFFDDFPVDSPSGCAAATRSEDPLLRGDWLRVRISGIYEDFKPSDNPMYTGVVVAPNDVHCGRSVLVCRSLWDSRNTTPSRLPVGYILDTEVWMSPDPPQTCEDDVAIPIVVEFTDDRLYGVRTMDGGGRNRIRSIARTCKAS